MCGTRSRTLEGISDIGVTYASVLRPALDDARPIDTCSFSYPILFECVRLILLFFDLSNVIYEAPAHAQPLD